MIRIALKTSAALRPCLLALAVCLPAQAQTSATPATCVTGPWSVIKGDPNDADVRYETPHFAFRWKADQVQMADARSAGAKLEAIWQLYMTQIGFTEPFCDTAEKHKANINLDPTFGLTGGYTGDRDMGMWVGPGALRDNWGLAHEFAHALQGSSRGMRDSPYSGWLWESHANWMAHQLPEFHKTEAHCSEMLVNYPHLYYGSTRDRYCNWQFLEYVKDTYGYQAVNDIWLKAPRSGDPRQTEADPFSVLAHNQGWTIDQLNDVFGQWALHNVAWDYTDPDGNDQAPFYRRTYGPYEPTSRNPDRALRVTTLEPTDLAARRFAVPFAWAPQHWGYNLVRLMPDVGASQISVSFRGIIQDKAQTPPLPGLNNEPTHVPAADSDWRWGVVAIGADGAPRYSPMVSGSDADMTFPLKPGDTAIYMVVVATPDSLQKIQWDQAYYSIYRYPWMVQLAGALPQGFEPGAASPVPNGHRHPNGGGWVSNSAHVDATAYVGPYARVLGGAVTGHARIEDHALILNGTVSDNATVGAMSVIDNGVTVKDSAVVRTVFKGIGAFEPGTVLSGTAQIWGDAEVRGGPQLSKGVYTGFVDQDSQKDAKQGADLTAAPPEVTQVPSYVWRP